MKIVKMAVDGTEKAISYIPVCITLHNAPMFLGGGVIWPGILEP